MKNFRFLALLSIVILLVVYLLTHTKKPQVPKTPEKVTTSSRKIPLPKSTVKEHTRSSQDLNHLDAIEEELLSQIELVPEELFKVPIKGYVYNPKSQPLKDARVSLEMDNTDTFEGTIVYTDENGFFEISGEFLKGKYTLTVQHLEYINAHDSIEINSNRDEIKYIMLLDYGR